MVKPLPSLETESNFQSMSTNEKMRALLDAFCGSTTQYGFPVKPFSERSLPAFSRLSEPMRTNVLENFCRFYSIVNSALREKIAPTDHARMLWWAIRELGYRPCSDLFDKIGRSHYFEIYNSDNIQIYRSFNFFRISSYTLDDLLCRPWYELYVRDERIDQKLRDFAIALFTGKIQCTVPLLYDTYPVTERDSEKRWTVLTTHDYVSPLYDNDGKTTALVLLSLGEVLDQPGP